MSHFVAWIHEESTRIAPARAQVEGIVTRAFAPLRHVTGQIGLSSRLSVGDVIWLVRSTKSLGRFEAALDGRISVAKIEREDELDRQKLVVKAGEGSAWLPWRDAGVLIRACRFRSGAGSVRLHPDRSLAQQLRITRQLDPDSAPQVEAFADEIRSSRSVFVSYRWQESGELVPLILPLLAERGLAVWWDRWSGPRRLREECAPDDDLAQMLSLAIGRSDTALVVRTRDYDRARWTAHEFREIVRQRVPRLEVSGDDLARAISDGSAAILADRIRGLVHQPG
jgi:hypothetical protein